MAIEGATSGEGERCTWCGVAVERDDGFRLIERPGERSAAFCRLEHVVPWAFQGGRWGVGEPEDPDAAPAVDAPQACAHCGEELGDVRITLTRHRGEHRIPDAFCSVDHAAAWARAGGRWQ
jgi:hypothetical protein